MKKMNLYLIIGVVLLLSLLISTFCACDKVGVPIVENMPTPRLIAMPNATQSPVVTPEPTSELVGELLTEVDLQRLTEEFSYPFDGGYGWELLSFLTCTYNTPSEIDPNEVFCNGASEATDEEKDFLVENGYNVPANWRDLYWPDGTPYEWFAGLLRVSTMDEVLMRRLGICLNEVKMEYGTSYYFNEWVEEYEAYLVRHSDTNLVNVMFTSGQYVSDNTYIVDYVRVSWGGDIAKDGTYRVTFTMTDNDPDTIMFISNVKVG